jgi:hypothetical protein
MQKYENMLSCTWKKRLELWPDNWFLHHDSVPVHQVLSDSVQHKKYTVGLVHTDYSLDILPIAFAIMKFMV